MDTGRHVLLEGAQATFLDLDHGTYPFVTSSNPVAGGACTGSGLGPRDIERVIGIAKAYVTRVGAGPFPTEQQDDVGDLLVERGHEFGTNTGRKRRCGWFDARDAASGRASQLTVRSGADQARRPRHLRVGQGLRRLRGGRHPLHAPALPPVHLPQGRPVYEELPGWCTDLSAATAPDDMPAAARDYVSFLSEQIGVPVRLVGVGPRTRAVRVLRHRVPRVCVVGSGGREHALAHVLSRTSDVVVTPGNPGMTPRRFR